MHFRKGEFSSLAPGLNSTFNLWRPKEAGALGSFGPFFILGWDVHIIASTAMLCAVATGVHGQFRCLGPGLLSMETTCRLRNSGGLPLGEVLIAANVPSFARFAAFSTFCMASTRGTSAWTCHR